MSQQGARFCYSVKCSLASAVVLAAAWLAVSSARAATVVFSSSTDTTLDTASNWSTGSIPGTADEAVLDNSLVTLPSALTLSSSQTFGDLVINSNTLNGISLTGATSFNIALSGAGGSTAATAAGGTAGDLLVLGSNVTSGTVTIGGGSGAGSLGLALGASGNFDVLNAGATLNVSGIVSGANLLTKTGSGALLLSNTANSYSGGTKIAGGLLDFANGALGATGTIEFTGNATLQWAGTNTQDISSRLKLDDGVTAKLEVDGSNTVTLGTALLTGPAKSAGITKLGSGTLSLGSIALSSTGVVNVYNGMLTTTQNGAGNGAPLGSTIFLGDPTPGNTNSATLFYNNAVSNSASITVNAGSSGTLALMVENDTTTQTSPITLNNNLLLDLNNTSAGKKLTFGSTITENGASALTLSASNGGGVTTGTVYINGGIVVSSGGLTVANLANAGQLQINGGVTGTGSLALQTISTNTAGLLVQTGTLNNVGTITNNSPGSSAITVTSIIGPNVTGVIQNSPTSLLVLSGANTFAGGLTVKSGTAEINTPLNTNALGSGTLTVGDAANTGAAASVWFNGSNAFPAFSNPLNVTGNGADLIYVNNWSPAFSGAIKMSNNLTLAVTNTGSGGSNMAFNGGLSGSGNVTVSIDYTTTNNFITFGTAAVNNSGTLTFNNAAINGGTPGTGTGTNQITGGVGSNVTAITQASNSNPLTISTGSLAVNAGGTTLNQNGTATLTVAGGIGGSGNLVLNNNSTTASGITINTTGVNNQGTITNSGSGSGGALISSNIGSNVTGIIENSASSSLTLNGSNAFTGGVLIKAGNVLAGNASAFGPSSGTITLGDSGGTANSQISGANFNFANPIVVAGGNTGTATISTNSNAPTYSGPITLSNHDLNFGNVGFNISVTGGISGTGSITLTSGGAGVITLSGSAVNPIGSITNSGAGGSATNAINASIGGNVVNVTQTSTATGLTLGASNAFTGNLIVKQGTVNLNNVAAASSGAITLGDSSSAGAVKLEVSGVGGTLPNAINLFAGASNASFLLDSTNNTTTNGGPNANGQINLNGNTLTISGNGGGGGQGNFVVTGGIVGTQSGSNLILQQPNSNTVAVQTGMVNINGTITQNGSGGSGTFTLSAPLGGSVLSVTQSGAASLTLSGSNTAFAGSVSISKGSLIIGNSLALNSANVVSVGTPANNAKLDIGGKNVTIAGLNDLTSGSGGNVTNSSATAATLSLGGSGSYSFSGVISDGATVPSMSVAMTGTGMQTLSGANTWTGATTVSNGTLNITGSLTGVTSHVVGQRAPLINGVNLDSSASAPRLLLPVVPTLVGTTTGSTAIDTGVHNTQIVPYFVGETAIGSGNLGTATGTANTFLTYNATTGLRPLNLNDEFDDWSGGTISTSADAGDNVTVGINNSASSITYNPATNFAINSLVISSATNPALTIAGSKTLTITSGALLVNQNSTTSVAGAGTLDFGTAEAIISPYQNSTISAAVTLEGGALTKSGPSNLTISGPITTTGNLTIFDPTSATFTASGGILSSGTGNLIINANNTGAMTLGTGTINNAGTITNSGSGSATLTISGVIGPNVTGLNQNSATSQLAISGVANTFTGPISVASGATITVSGDGSLGNPSNGIALNNGTLKSSGAVFLNPSRTITLNGGGVLTGNAALAVEGNIVGTGMLTITSNITTVLSGNNTYSGTTSLGNTQTPRLLISSDANIGGLSSPLALAGEGGETLSILGTQMTTFGTRTVTFGVVNDNGSLGTVEIQDPNNVFNWNVNDTYGMNSANTNFTKSGQGTLMITTTQTGMYGNGTQGSGINFNGGTFEVNAAAGGQINTASRVTFAGGTYYLLGKGTAATSQSFLALDNNGGAGSGVAAGGGTIILDNNNGSSTTTLSIAAVSAADFAAGSSLDIYTKNVGAGSVAISSTTANDATGIFGYGRTVYGTTDNADWAAVVSGSTLGQYSGYNTTFPVSAASNTTNYKLTGAGSVSTSETANTLKITPSGSGQSLTISAGQAFTVNSGGLLFTGSNAYSITGGSVNSNTATNSDLIVSQYGSGTLTIGSVIANGLGASTLTKAGPGLLVLASSSTYTGQTYINGGVLSISNNNQLNNGAATTLNINAAATLQVTGSIATSRNVVIGGGGGSLDVADGQTLTLSGIVSGAGLNINDSGPNGTGLVQLNGANTFSGGLWLNAGILQLGNTSAVNSNGYNTLTFGSGNTTKLQLNGNNAIFAGLTASSSRAIIENSSGTAATLSVYSGAPNTYAGTLQDGSGGTASLGFAKGGGFNLLLSGTSTYSGNTTIGNGTLQFATTNAISPNSTYVVNVNNGLLFNSGETAVTIGGLGGFGNQTLVTADNLPIALTVGGNGANTTYSGTLSDGGSGGSLAKVGGGALTLAGPVNLSGASQLNAGTLVLSNTMTLGGGSFTLNGGTLATPANSVALINGAVVAGSGPHFISPGGSGAIGTLNVSSLTLNTNSSLAFDISSSSSLDQLLDSGALSFAASNSVANLIVPGSLANGTYKLIGFGSDPSVTTSNFNLVTSGTNYTLSLANTGELDLVVGAVFTNPNYTLSASAASHMLIVGGSSSITASIANNGGGVMPDSINYGGFTAAATGGTIGGSATSGNVSPGNSASNTGLSFASNTPGVYTITPTATVTGAGGSTPVLQSTGTDSITVYGHASPVLGGTALSLPVVHQGFAGTLVSTSATIGNAAGMLVNLKTTGGGASAGGITLSGDLSGLTPGGAAGTIYASTTIASSQSAGSFNQSFPITLADDSALPGASSDVGSGTLTVTGGVFSGNGRWTGTGGTTSWASNANWTDANGVQAAPGTFMGYVDTAVLDNTGLAHNTITLDGASPTLTSLTFNTAASGYTLQQGTGGTLTMTGGGTMSIVVGGGTHTISAPLEVVGGDLEVSASNNGILTISGNLSDNGAGLSLTLDGDGTGELVLSGTNTFGGSGGTATVSSGTLVLMNNEALADGTSLVVGDASFFGGIQPAGASAASASSAAAAGLGHLAPVPEPSTAALFAAIVAGAAVYRRVRRQRTSRCEFRQARPRQLTPR